uniref:Uncharacterized protein n=1 Tax=Parascaris equorum TaxID=6256 RepID=A0A914R3J3_PAREQ
MGAWLKTAERNGDWNRLKLLLSQCAQANLTVELLQANDTPKFVRKLSKSCVDIGGPEDSQKAEPSRVAAVVQKSKSDSATTIESEAVAVKSEGAKKAQSTSGTEKGEKSDKGFGDKEDLVDCDKEDLVSCEKSIEAQQKHSATTSLEDGS